MEPSESSTKTKWIIDLPHSEFGFKVKHLMITYVRGVFRDVQADIYTSGNDFSAADIEVRVNPASIDTGDAKRDAHLKSPDFFDVENHREIIFIGKRLNKTEDENKFKLYGELTIKGVTMPVELDVEFLGMNKDPYQNEKAGFTIEGKISRKDWELNWNTALETGGVLVGDEVKISCEIQLIKQTLQV